MARVSALVDAGKPEVISLDVDAARAFDVLAARQSLRPPPCGWRALFTAGHAACAASRKCKCNRTGARPYDSAVEGPIAARVKPLLSRDLQALVQA